MADFSIIKKVISVHIVLFALFLGQVEAIVIPYPNNYELYQENPIPPGGKEKFRLWVAKNYVLPNEAKLNKVQGRIILAFIIERDGSLSNFSIDNDLGYGTGEAAVRLFKNSPKWTAATKNGKAVRAFYKFPIMITLEEGTSESSYPAYVSTSTAPLPPAPKVGKGVVEYTEDKRGQKEAVLIKGTIGNTESNVAIYNSVDQEPLPVGGIEAFRIWIGNNYAFPQEAIDNGVDGMMNVQFIIEKDGSLSNIKVNRDLGYGTGEALVRLLKRAEKWSPGIEKGRPVRVRYSLPIRLVFSDL